MNKIILNLILTSSALVSLNAVASSNIQLVSPAIVFQGGYIPQQQVQVSPQVINAQILSDEALSQKKSRCMSGLEGSISDCMNKYDQLVIENQKLINQQQQIQLQQQQQINDPCASSDSPALCRTQNLILNAPVGGWYPYVTRPSIIINRTN